MDHTLQPPLSMGFSRQEHWSELPFPSTGDLPDPGLKPVPPALAGGFFTAEPRKALCLSVCMYVSVCMHLFISTSLCVTAAVHSHASSLSNQSPNAGHLDCFWSFAYSRQFCHGWSCISVWAHISVSIGYTLAILPRRIMSSSLDSFHIPSGIPCEYAFPHV